MSGAFKTNVRRLATALLVTAAMVLSASVVQISTADDPQHTTNEGDQSDVSNLPSIEFPAWYIMEQADCQGLFHGMPQQLEKLAASTKETDPAWAGVSEGGQVELDIEVVGEIRGEILVGFFADPNWSDTPLQVRRVAAGGRNQFKGLMPGKFYLGAVMKNDKDIVALGVHRQWPEPIEIKTDEPVQVQLRVSEKFTNVPCGVPWIQDQFSDRWDKMEAGRLLSVQTLDEHGKPLPFCRITLATRLNDNPKMFDQYVEFGTNIHGLGYTDRAKGLFSVSAQRFGVVPGTFIEWYEATRFTELYDARQRPLVQVKWGPFPSGTAEISGQLHSQHGRPLTEYYLTICCEKGKRLGDEKYTEIGYSIPVMNADGRFRVTHLPAGQYSGYARGFDIQAFVLDLSAFKFAIPEEPNAKLELDFQVEEKELYYGRAKYSDGSPVYPGRWSVSTKSMQERGYAVGGPTQPDGSFRVALTVKESLEVINDLKGAIEFSDKAGELPSVHLDRLSRDPKEPGELVIEALANRRETQPDLKKKK